jgi:AraC-like DNA-binding protein
MASAQREEVRLVSFSDATAFSRPFKQWTGLRPGEYVTRRMPQA